MSFYDQYATDIIDNGITISGFVNFMNATSAGMWLFTLPLCVGIGLTVKYESSLPLVVISVLTMLFAGIFVPYEIVSVLVLIVVAFLAKIFVIQPLWNRHTG